MFPVRLALGIIFAWGLTACANLSHIQQFAEASAKAIDLYDNTGFSALGYCQENYCVDPVSYTSGIITPQSGCSCSEFSDADKSIQAINSTVALYFHGVSALADKHVAEVNLTAASSAINRLSSNAKLGIRQSDVKAASDWATQLGSLALSGFRRKKLKLITGNADAGLAAVIDVQEKNMEYLTEILRQQHTENKLAINAMRQKATEVGLKYLLSKELIREEERQKVQSQILQKFKNTIEKIKEGHHVLYENRNSLKDAAFRKKIWEQAEAIREMIKDLQSLNHAA